MKDNTFTQCVNQDDPQSVILDQYHSLIRRVMRENVELGSVTDLYQAAALGLLEAVRTQPQNGDFEHYAYGRAVFAVKHYLASSPMDHSAELIMAHLRQVNRHD